MKRKILIITAILLILEGGFSSCKDKNEPVEIPFTEYYLTGTQCQWTNIDYNSKVIIINSSADLEKYMSCTEGTYPEIDFSKQTLLLASGDAGKVIHTITKKLQKLSKNKYKLYIEIIPSDAPVALPTKWEVGLIIDKLNKESNVELVVSIIGGGQQ
jgi:hypothetical protein